MMPIPIMSVLRIFRERLSKNLFRFIFITNGATHVPGRGAALDRSDVVTGSSKPLRGRFKSDIFQYSTYDSIPAFEF